LIIFFFLFFKKKSLQRTELFQTLSYRGINFVPPNSPSLTPLPKRNRRKTNTTDGQVIDQLSIVDGYVPRISAIPESDSVITDEDSIVEVTDRAQSIGSLNSAGAGYLSPEVQPES
jgi:hypothetical protein